MVTPSKKIWMDGVFVDWNDASIHILTHSLHYGLGAFEGIRCYQGKNGSAIFRLREHVDRLFESAHIMLMTVPYSRKDVTEAIVETVRINKLPSCYIRPLLYVGEGEMGLDPSHNPVKLAIAAWSWGDPYLGDDALARGVRAKVSSFARHHVNVAMTRAKVPGYYVNSILARLEAQRAGYDEAIFLDTDGYVAEGTGENVFIVAKGVLTTTPLTSVLEGITRHTILDLAREKNIPVAEERFTRDALYVAEEVFLTGTAAEVTPIREIDDRQVGTGKRGPITDLLQNVFFDIVKGAIPSHAHWLTPV